MSNRDKIIRLIDILNNLTNYEFDYCEDKSHWYYLIEDDKVLVKDTGSIVILSRLQRLVKDMGLSDYE